nr:MAG: hypothetical protein 2 [Leviviridae sp.]
MSFADPITVTYNSVSKDLARVNQDSGGSDFYLDDGDIKFHCRIRHTIPPKGGDGESHMFRLDAEVYDNGVYKRTDSVWLAMRTDDGPQSSVDLQYLASALAGFMGSGVIAKLTSREN